MVKWSETGGNVLRQLQIRQILHTDLISAQTDDKTEYFGPTFLRHFPLRSQIFLEFSRTPKESFTVVPLTQQ
jgi:hypothetical protein